MNLDFLLPDTTIKAVIYSFLLILEFEFEVFFYQLFFKVPLFLYSAFHIIFINFDSFFHNITFSWHIINWKKLIMINIKALEIKLKLHLIWVLLITLHDNVFFLFYDNWSIFFNSCSNCTNFYSYCRTRNTYRDNN